MIKLAMSDPQDHAWVLVRKGLVTNEEVLEEVGVVRKGLEGKRGR